MAAELKISWSNPSIGPMEAVNLANGTCVEISRDKPSHKLTYSTLDCSLILSYTEIVYCIVLHNIRTYAICLPTSVHA